MLRIAHPRQKLAIAALAIGFWSQVYLWHGVIHGPGVTRVERVRALGPIVTQSPVAPTPPSPPVRPFRRREVTYGCNGGPRTSDRPPLENTATPPDHAILKAIRAAVPDIQEHDADLPRAGRVDVRVAVSAEGRVSRVTLYAEPGQLSRAGRRVIERAVKRAPFPAFTQAYVMEYPLIFQGGR